MNHKSKYIDCLDLPWFIAVFSEGRYAVMSDRRDVKRNTDIGGGNFRYQVGRFYCSGWLDPDGLFDVLSVSRKDACCVSTCFVLPSWLMMLDLLEAIWT